ncbi:hypothetical protein [Kitasatospora cheerisanensis]|uniref:hypothetical protein n=1 Tax=Kitasatospora cheerisanensis TaxID=81942 RepID=UPI0012ED00FC|nr:hypothetical protein [Kitasatospora cheerisanensis]
MLGADEFGEQSGGGAGVGGDAGADGAAVTLPHGAQLPFVQAGMGCDRGGDPGVGIVGEPVPDGGGEVAAEGGEAAQLAVGGAGERVEFGGRGGGDPGRWQGSEPDGGADPVEHVERDARVLGGAATHVLGRVGGQPAEQVFADGGVAREWLAHPDLRVRGERGVRGGGEVGAPGELGPEVRRLGVEVGEDVGGGRGGVLERGLQDGFPGELVAAVAGRPGVQGAVGVGAVRRMHPGDGVPFADLATLQRRKVVDQVGEDGRGRVLVAAERRADVRGRVGGEQRGDRRIGGRLGEFGRHGEVRCGCQPPGHLGRKHRAARQLGVQFRPFEQDVGPLDGREPGPQQGEGGEGLP